MKTQLILILGVIILMIPFIWLSIYYQNKKKNGNNNKQNKNNCKKFK